MSLAQEISKPNSPHKTPSLDHTTYPRLGSGESINEIVREHLPPHSASWLGRRAVHQSLYEAQRSMHERSVDHDESFINQARYQLRKLSESPNDAAMFQRLLLSQPKSAWLDAELDIDRDEIGKHPTILIDKLLARDPNGRFKVSNETFENFLEWHNYVLNKDQKALDKLAGKEREIFIDSIHRAVTEGWLPPELLERLDRVEHVPILLDDGLKLDPRRTQGATHHHRNRRMHEVFVGPVEVRNLHGVLTHEFLHVINGKEIDNMRHDNKRALESHGLYRIFGGGMGARQLDEGLVEHIRSSLERGNVGETDPTSKARQDLAYKEGRGLLHVLATQGLRKVDIRYFIDAEFEENEETAKAGLQTILRQAFPFINVIDEIGRLRTKQDVIAFTAKLTENARQYKRRHPVEHFGTRLASKRIA